MGASQMEPSRATDTFRNLNVRLCEPYCRLPDAPPRNVHLSKFHLRSWQPYSGKQTHGELSNPVRQ